MAAVGAVALLAVAATPQSMAGPRPRSNPSPSLVDRAHSVQGRLSDLTEELWAKVVPTDPDFSAFRHDAGRARVTVYRSGETSAAHEQAYRQHLPAGLSMSFAPAVLSRRQAQILRELISSKAEWLKVHGIRVGSSGIGAGEPYSIGYAGNEPSAQTIEPFLIFGPGTVRFVQEPPPVPLSREADTYPFGVGPM